MKTINTRRSIRKYSDKEVSEELLSRLLTEAARTQTMGNMQLYSVVVTRSDEMKAKLAPAHFNQPMVTQAPVVLTICADFNRASTWCRCRKAEPGYDNFLSFINAASDALLYTQTFCNLAEEEGLGLCYLGTTVYMPQMIIDVLGLPKLVMPVATITLGWPDEIRRSPTACRLLRLYTARLITTILLPTSTSIMLRKRRLRKPRVRKDKQQGNSCADIHRHTLYKERQRCHVGWYDGGS